MSFRCGSDALLLRLTKRPCLLRLELLDPFESSQCSYFLQRNLSTQAHQLENPQKAGRGDARSNRAC